MRIFRVRGADAPPASPIPSRALPPPPQAGSSVWTAAHVYAGGSSASRSPLVSVRSSLADPHPRRMARSRGFRSLLDNDCGASTVTCM